MNKNIRHVLRGGSDETWCGEKSEWNFFNLDHATAMQTPSEVFAKPGAYTPCPDCLRAALQHMGYDCELKSLA